MTCLALAWLPLVMIAVGVSRPRPVTISWRTVPGYEDWAVQRQRPAPPAPRGPIPKDVTVKQKMARKLSTKPGREP